MKAIASTDYQLVESIRVPMSILPLVSFLDRQELKLNDFVCSVANKKAAQTLRLSGFSVFCLCCCDPAPQAGITYVISSLSEVKKQQARCAVFSFFLRNAKINLAFASKRKSPFGGLVAFSSDPAGIRTQDPYIKSVMLYQLSYEILPFTLL